MGRRRKTTRRPVLVWGSAARKSDGRRTDKRYRQCCAAYANMPAIAMRQREISLADERCYTPAINRISGRKFDIKMVARASI
jgi:hypothetical protein